MENDKKKKHSAKRKQILNYSFLFVGLFAVTAVGAYFAIPSNVKTAGVKTTTSTDSSTSVTSESSQEDDGPTPSELFVAKLASGVSGVKANVSLTAGILNSSKAVSDVIQIAQTPLYFAMPSLQDIRLAFAPTVTYTAVTDASVGGSTSKSFDFTYLDSTLYLSALGTKYKCSVAGLNSIIDRLAEDPFNLDGESLAGTLAGSTSNMDTSKFTDALGAMEYVKQSDGSYTYALVIDNYTIHMASDSNYNLTKVWAADLAIQDKATVSFEVTVEKDTEIDTHIVAPSDSASYLELFNTMDLAADITKLVKTPRFGLTGNLSLTEGGADPKNKPVSVKLAANADVTNKLVGAALDVTCNSVTQNLTVDYLNADGAFLTYNDAIKAAMTYADLDALLGKMKENLGTVDASKATSLFDFITKSEVMSAISAGHYEKVVDMLSSITTENNKLTFDISLKGLGLGDNADLKVTLDGTSASSALASVSFSAVEMKAFTLEGTFSLQDYVVPSVDKTAYKTLDMMPTVWDQGYALTQSKQAAVTLTGSVMDQASASASVATGFTFDGSTEFDIGAKKGTGKIAIKNQTAKFEHTHTVTIDVQGPEGTNEDGSASSMLFTYGSSASSNQLKGKNTIKTLNDIIGIGKTLMNSTDARYTKFLDPLKESSANTVIGMIVSGNYASLVENKVLTAAALTAEGTNGAEKMSFTIAKKLLGTDEDFNVTIGFDSAKKLSSLSVGGLKMSSKAIDVTLTLGTYDAKAISQLDPKDTYMDFSDIAVLLQFGIDSSEPAYWHLTANANVNIDILTGIDIGATLDFYIYVNGATCKVIGYINNIPTIPLANSTHSGTRDLTFIYDADKIYLRGVNHWQQLGWFEMVDKTSEDDHVYTASYFVNHITTCLLHDGLGLYTTWTNKIGDKTVGDDSKAIAYENILKSFTYNAGATSADQSALFAFNKKMGNTETNSSGTEVASADAATKLWVIDTDIGVLAQNSQLKDLTLSIGGRSVTTGKVTKNYLTALDLTLTVQAGINITVTMQAHNIDIGVDFSAKFNSSSDFATYLTKHANDTVTGA